MTAPFVISTKWDTCLEWITNWHYPELRGYFTLKSLLHSGLKQVMSLFTLGSARAVLVVALVYSFPDVFNVIMALISPYTNQPFIVPIWRTSIVSWDQVSFDSNIWCIGVFSQFQLHVRYCTKITLKSPNPCETSERMNFNVIDEKTINLKTVYILISDVLFHKKMSQNLWATIMPFGPVILIFYWPKNKISVHCICRLLHCSVQ